MHHRNKTSFTEHASRLLRNFKVPEGDPATVALQLLHSIQVFVYTLENDLAQEHDTLDWLGRIIQHGNLHTLPTAPGEASVLSRVKEIPRIVGDILKFKEALTSAEGTTSVSNTIQQFLTGDIDYSNPVVREILPAFLVYTDKPCRDAAVALGNTVKGIPPKVLYNPLDNTPGASYKTIQGPQQELSNKEYFEKLYQAVEDFLNAYGTRVAEGNYHVVTARKVSESLDRIASRLENAGMTRQAMLLDSVANAFSL